MKLKKIIAVLLSVVTAGTCLATAGCNNDSNKPSADPKTVNLMMAGGGYGTKWIDEIIDKFEEVYAEEGYKINRLPVSNSFGTATALAEMRQGINSGYDIVMPGSVYAYDALDPTFGICVESLDDLYASKPIGFDGKEESVTIEQKLKIDEHSTWTGKDVNNVADGEWYGYFLTSSTNGIVCNTQVLANYAGVTDFDEEYPRTSAELFAYFDKIASNEDAQNNSVMPLIYAGDNSNGASTYSCRNVSLSIGQILGIEEHNKRWSMEEFYAANGNQYYSDDWKYEFENEAMIPTLEYVMQAWDSLYAVNGAENMTLNVAHGNLMLGMSAFMFDGNYFYNEVRENYESLIGDVRMIPNTVISYVGLKYELCGVDHNVGVGNNSGVECANCDKIMSAIIKGYDDHKDAATIKSEVESEFSITLTDEQVEGIIEARSCAYGISEPAYIVKGSTKTDIAKLFLRMLASDDASKIMNKYGMMTVYSDPVATSDTPQFVKDCFEISTLGKWGVDIHSRPDTKKVSYWIPKYNATIGVQIHADMDNDKSWTERDYAKMAKEMTSEGGVVYEYAKNTWKTSVQTKALVYNEATNPNHIYD